MLMKKISTSILLLLCYQYSYCWGFFAHQKINYYAVLLLPPQMMAWYKPKINFIAEHAVDADKRRYLLPTEAPRHYIDIDHYGTYPYKILPRNWDSAIAVFSEDTLYKYGIVPWWITLLQHKLTKAFKEKKQSAILKLSADIGHYIADAHVPLHASSNHNGQLTQQEGIHAFWESRIPELLAEKEWNFFIGKANYINNVGDFIWDRVLESAAAADTVLKLEKQLSASFKPQKKFSFEERNGLVVKQYSSAYALAYNKLLNGMVERRMRMAIYAVASCWYTAWVNAGQPNLTDVGEVPFSKADKQMFETLNKKWNQSGTHLHRDE
jgi:hypothetical protein